MRSSPALLIAIMCLSLLTMQMSGLHLHVSVDGQSGAHDEAHLHDAKPGGHDHDGEIDVSSFEPGVTWSKLIPFFMALIFALLPVIRTSTAVRPPLVERLSTRHRSRWRPPLRAPPQHIL